MNYPKISRIHIREKPVGKHYLTEDQVKELLDGEVVIEEKLDGKIEAEERDGMIVYKEYLEWKHSIPYDKLPAWFVAFDVLDPQTQRFLDYDRKKGFLENYGYAIVPLLYRGRIKSKYDLNEFLRPSMFSSVHLAEGIVVKNYAKQLFGKVVREEFIESIDKHWSRKPREKNRLAITANPSH